MSNTENNKAETVQLIAHRGNGMVKEVFAYRDIEKEFSARGYFRSGTSHGENYVHPLIRNQPIFKGLAGPFYQGEYIIRYETWGVYNQLAE